MPAISVIVPVYNTEAHLNRCIESILAQTFTDFELILVDDGSPDNCGTICDNYACIDSRVRVIHQKNGGVSEARNTGLCAAIGQYVLFIDSDDYADLELISKLYSQKSDLTICGIETRNEKNIFLNSTHYTPGNFERKSAIDFPQLYENNVLYSPYCKLFRNNIIKEHQLRFPTDITWGEDGMFVADYLQYIESLAVIDYIGYYYIKYEGDITLSTKVRENIIDMIVVSREYCINKMQVTSPQNFEAVKAICTEDIRRNCAYFVLKLLDCACIGKRTKINILDSFMHHVYVSYTLENPKMYYSNDVETQSIFSEPNPVTIVNTYQKLRRKQKFRAYIYRHFYEWQPKVVKKAYRKLKRKVQR